MRRSLVLAVLCAALAITTLVLPGPAMAKGDSEQALDPRFALGLGFGIVRPEDSGEGYINASLRIRINRDDKDRDNYYDRETRPARHRDEGIRAYIEPEIGYWESDFGGRDVEDLLAGVNIVGVVPTRHADYFIGAGVGIHFFDSRVTTLDTDGIDNLSDLSLNGSDERVGVNLQVGVDINLTPGLSLFGVGRLDLVEGAPDDTQEKIYLGLRFKLGSGR